MNEPFVVFKSYNDPELASALAEFLGNEQIPYEIEDTSSRLDPVIIGTSLEPDIRIKIRPKDFEQAHAILERQSKLFVESVGKDHYLFTFSNNELVELIENPFDWGELDYQLAQKILKERGVNIDTRKIEESRVVSLKKLSKQDNISKSWIFLGYFLAIFFSLIGIIYGSSITTLKKTLPDGQRIFSYNEESREHGKSILLLSSIFTVLWTILFFL